MPWYLLLIPLNPRKPKSIPSDFYYILSDPTIERLARMIQVGQHETFPKLLCVSNRLRIERLVQKGRRKTRGKLESEAGKILELDNQQQKNIRRSPIESRSPNESTSPGTMFSWFSSWSHPGGQDVINSLGGSQHGSGGVDRKSTESRRRGETRRGSRLEEISRQSSVIFGFDGSDVSTDDTEYEEAQEAEQRYLGSAESELGESDTYSGGEDAVRFVEGGERALL